MDAAISHYLRQTPGQPVVLTGYSGGGAIAVLIAARCKDIALLRTVAGNLNHVAVNRLHRVAPMPDSLNPADVASEIAAVPQLHFSGDTDRIVPSVVPTFLFLLSGVVPMCVKCTIWIMRAIGLRFGLPYCRCVSPVKTLRSVLSSAPDKLNFASPRWKPSPYLLG